MKAPAPTPANCGLTLPEVLLLVALLSLIALLMIPGALVKPHPARDRLTKTLCANNLKAIGTAMQEFGAEHGGRLSPLNFPPTEAPIQTDAFLPRIFESLSNYSLLPQHLLCPADKAKTGTPPQATITNSNISYFASLDATVSVPNALTAGDRNLRSEEGPLHPGILSLRANDRLGWTASVHLCGNEPCGNILLADGHVATSVTNQIGRAHV